MTAQFVATQRVEFGDTDASGLTHFSAYFLYMERAQHAFFRSLGFSTVEAGEDGTVVSWPRVSVSCDYLAPARFEEELRIAVSVSRIGTKSLTMGFEFLNRAGIAVARGRIVAACCQFHDGQMESVPIPESMRNPLNQHLDPPQNDLE